MASAPALLPETCSSPPQPPPCPEDVLSTPPPPASTSPWRVPSPRAPTPHHPDAGRSISDEGANPASSSSSSAAAASPIHVIFLPLQSPPSRWTKQNRVPTQVADLGHRKQESCAALSGP
ncbi:hypothetical protein ACP70R_033485 [Stipagrostis hirtigluma subsp. patula]